MFKNSGKRLYCGILTVYEMYQVLGKISEADVPVVFKGALITKLILAEHNFPLLDRPTVDIDANWIGASPTMDDLVSTIQQSLGDMRELFHVVAIREYEEKKSAGISIKPVTGSKTYYYGEIGIKGVLANEILADKITHF